MLQAIQMIIGLQFDSTRMGFEFMIFENGKIKLKPNLSKNVQKLSQKLSKEAILVLILVITAMFTMLSPFIWTWKLAQPGKQLFMSKFAIQTQRTRKTGFIKPTLAKRKIHSIWLLADSGKFSQFQLFFSCIFSVLFQL